MDLAGIAFGAGVGGASAYLLDRITWRRSERAKLSTEARTTGHAFLEAVERCRTEHLRYPQRPDLTYESFLAVAQLFQRLFVVAGRDLATASANCFASLATVVAPLVIEGEPDFDQLKELSKAEGAVVHALTRTIRK